MKRLLFVLLLLISLCDISAQTTISGNVRNEKKENVFNVTVVIKNISDNLIVGYSSTDENGLFSVTYDSNDSLLALNVQGFNIKKEICKIENKSQHIDIVIKEEPIVLQEVSVKSEKVWENNDTISYLADAFRDTTDIVIADVLKKMPGIEVKDDGKIEYKGKAISKFYIEDMDMLQSEARDVAIHKCFSEGIFSAVNLLESTISQDEKIVLAPLGTRPHSMACAIFACRRQNARIIYDFVIENENRAVGISNITIYHLSSFIKN